MLEKAAAGDLQIFFSPDFILFLSYLCLYFIVSGFLSENFNSSFWVSVKSVCQAKEFKYLGCLFTSEVMAVEAEDGPMTQSFDCSNVGAAPITAKFLIYWSSLVSSLNYGQNRASPVGLLGSDLKIK